MEDWESEDFEPAPPSLKQEQPKGKWDDEDDEEEDVKESWEDEDTSKAPKAEPPFEKTASKPAGKVGGKKAKLTEGKTSEAKENVVADEVHADPVAEKLRQQRLVEEADYRSTTELFAKGGDGKTLDNFIPKSENDFLEYAELISHKLRPCDKSFHYIGLLKAVMRLSMTNMKAADAKEVASSVTAIANEKLKAEKEANAGKKKQGARKKQLHVDKPDNDVAVDGYDALDDYDFIVRSSGNGATIVVEQHPRGGWGPLPELHPQDAGVHVSRGSHPSEMGGYLRGPYQALCSGLEQREAYSRGDKLYAKVVSGSRRLLDVGKVPNDLLRRAKVRMLSYGVPVGRSNRKRNITRRLEEVAGGK
ncbi:hypothetical protein Taro_038701, partial [Colocasia esculenta]|nr:hypothetical protein [Colocasia esculenta]